MAEVPRYPTQYRVRDAVFSLFLMRAMTSVIETLGNSGDPVIGKPGELTADQRGWARIRNKIAKIAKIAKSAKSAN